MGRSNLYLIMTTVLLFAATATAQVCIDCHKKTTPNIVTDWQVSKHSKNDVDCTICHDGNHITNLDVAKVKMPTPETCAQCHEKQTLQFKKGKHSLGWSSMKAMPTIHW